MPELMCGGRRWAVSRGENLLNALLQGGIAVSHSCRAGSCQSCLVQCVAGEPGDAQPEALTAEQRSRGWRLACQCRVEGDLEVRVYDPQGEGIAAQVAQADWLDGGVLRLRLVPERPLRYQAGQHVLLWIDDQLARPYSLASLPGETAWLEFHLACGRPGAFADAARQLREGDRMWLGQLHGGALHYDPAWAEQPLLVLAGGTGLAPLWGVVREALRQGHQGPIRLIHVAAAAGHYLAAPLQALAREHGHLEVELLTELPSAIRATRRTLALVCGRASFVEACGRQLFLAGVPRGQVLTETFIEAGRRT